MAREARKAGAMSRSAHDDFIERPQPHDPKAERTVLAAILLDPKKIAAASEQLTAHDFYAGPNGAASHNLLIFAAMIALAKRQIEVHPNAIMDYLQSIGQSSDELMAYLLALPEGEPRGVPVSDLAFHARTIKQKSDQRRLIALGQAFQEAGFKERAPQQKITQVEEFAALREYATETLARISQESSNGAGSSDIQLQPYEEITKEHLHFMWPGYLPLGKLVHLAGDSGEGKSPLSLDLIARTTSGADWPDGSKNTLGPRSVILLAGEDNCADTIRPRLELAGAGLSRVFNVRCTVGKGQERHEILLALDRDVHQLAAQARKIPDLAGLYADPITNYLGKVQMKLEEEVRARLLMPLAALAAELNICIVTIGHLNRRDRGTSPLQRIMGAAAFHGVARYIYFVGPDPDDDDKFSHILVQQRGGNAPSLRYRTIVKPMTWDGETSDVVQIEWRGVSGATSQDAVDPQQGAEKSATDKAAKDLINILKSGRVAAVEAQQLLKDAGHDVEKLNWTRVHRKAHVGTDRFDGERFYSWFLKAQK
jgi:hypothetical protein